MTTNSWKVDANGDWSTAANWSLGSVPVSSQDVVISTANVRTITHSGGVDTVKSLTVGNDHFILQGGSLEILGTASFAMDFTQTGGDLLGSATVTVNGAGTLTGGYAGGSTAFQIGGTIALANYQLGGSTTLVNNHTVNQTGTIAVGDNTGVNATITNASGATYNISNDSSINAGATSAKLVNAGLLEKTAGSGTSFVSINVTDTGTVNVATGVMEFGGANNSIAGSISGAGQFAIGNGGASVINAGTTITTSAFAIVDNGTSVKLAENLAYNGAFSMGFGTTLNIQANTLTLNGTANLYNSNFGTPTVLGSGTLTTTGTTTVSGFVLGGSIIWKNTGIINEVGALQIGDSTGLQSRFSNASGAQYNIANDSNIIVGLNKGATFDNVGGLLAKTAGNGTSFVTSGFGDSTNTAAQIQVASGTLEFEGAVSSFVNQAISGAGQFALGGGGSNTIGAGTTITTGTFGIYDNGTSVKLAENLSYGGTFNFIFGTTVDVGGNTLTLSGASNFSNQNFGSPSFIGSGTVVSTGSTIVSGAVIGGSVLWKNMGTVNETGALQIGDGSGLATRIANSVGGVYNLTNDSGIGTGVNRASAFNNNGGTLAKTAGSGTSVISASFQDLNAAAAQIQIASGAIEFTGINNVFVSQTISGTGAFNLGNGSNSTIGAGTTISTGQFNIFDNGTSLTLAASLSFAGSFSQAFGTSINIGANSLSLSGPAAFANANFGTPTIVGSGKVFASGTTTIDGFVVGGTVTFKNTGTVLESGTLQVGDGSGQTAIFNNAAPGVYNFVNDSSITRGNATTSVFNNNGGTLIKSGGSGTSVVGLNFGNVSVTTGNVEVASGTLEFSGTVTGANAFKIDTATHLQFDSSVASGAAVAFNGGTSTLALGDAQDFTGTIAAFKSGNTLDLRSIGFGSNTTVGYTNNGNSGILTVSDGQHTANLALLGQYALSEFQKGNDGNGGTAITFLAPNTAAALAVPHHA